MWVLVMGLVVKVQEKRRQGIGGWEVAADSPPMIFALGAFS